MSNLPIIEIKGISKKYQIKHQQGGYVALRDVLANVLKSPFKFLKHKAKVAIGKESEEEFWALKDVNFNIEKGDTIGVIGHNGAGKSTLLKILTGITPPTTGEIVMRGRVASLLEVGTGFHPELTGRENIFLNGAILGMSKKEIVEKFDEIVKFSGVEKFLDTPVKRYSSGMYVRLAFSVAAHMEPDILLVDEVLAVGDAEFQKKCLGKMDEVTKKAGRTIVFVSHNMEAIRRLCNKCVLLENGQIKKFGKTDDVINYYLNKKSNEQAIYKYKIGEKSDAGIEEISIIKKNGTTNSQIPISENFSIKIKYSVKKQTDNALLSILFYSNGELFLLSSESDKLGNLKNYSPGDYETTVEIPAYLFNIGYYRFDVALHRPYMEYIDNKTDLQFEITDQNNNKSKIFKGQSVGRIASVLEYKTKK